MTDRARTLLKAGHADLDDCDNREVLRYVIEWAADQDDDLRRLHATVAMLSKKVDALWGRLTDPRTALTSINTDERNPVTMATQIHDNDNTKTISPIPGSYMDALSVTLNPDPVGLIPAWTSSNPAVATVDPATGLIAPVLPVTAGATTTITGTATNPDGSQVVYQPQDVEVIAGPPATVNTQIA